MHLVNCLFVGAGAAAAAYAADLDDTPLSVTGVCDLDPERADAVAETLDAAAYTDLDAMLAADPAPLVVVLTNHAAHAAVVERALTADRHVFCQKPLALAPDRARGLVALARDRDRALGCAPVAPRHPAQRRAGRLLADGRLGDVQLAYAHAHVGRVTEWHDDPESFLDVGPLYDGGVYPLTLLAAWFGPVARVRTADAAAPWPGRESTAPSAPSHVEATLSFADGPLVRLTASLYAPHRSREFNSLELHGDDGSLYLRDCGAGEDGIETVQFGRQGRGYTAVPPAGHTPDGGFADGPARLARAIERVDGQAGEAVGGQSGASDDSRGENHHDRTTGVRAAHVVAVCDAIERAAECGEPVTVSEPSTPGAIRDRPTPPPFGADTALADGGAGDIDGRVGVDVSRWLPLVGIDIGGRPRADTDTETAAVNVDTVAVALDAGCRLFAGVDTETVDAVADALAAPGGPDRETVHLSGRVSEPDDAVRLSDRLDGVDSVVVDDPEVWTAVVAAFDARGDTDGQPAFGIADATAERVERLAATDHPPAVAVATGHPGAALSAACRDNGVRLLVTDPASGDSASGDPADVDHTDTDDQRADERVTDDQKTEERITDDQRTDERAAVAAHVAAGWIPLTAARGPDRLIAALAGVHDARGRVRGERA